MLVWQNAGMVVEIAGHTDAIEQRTPAIIA
jgi:hypothetical protein